jgi:hypothetical protein
MTTSSVTLTEQYLSDSLSFELPEYQMQPRSDWHGYTRAVTVLTTLGPEDTKELLCKFMPGLTRQQHRTLGEAHLRASIQCQLDWGKTVNAAAQETFGRAYEATDYKISGIAREEFSEGRKNTLRDLAHKESAHSHVAWGHLMAAGLREHKIYMLKDKFVTDEALYGKEGTEQEEVRGHGR